MVSEKFLKETFPGLALKHISELVETELNLIVANGSSIPYHGSVKLEFCVTPEKQSLIVPFLVTKDNMDLPLIDYNVIEEHLGFKNNDTNLSTLMACFPTTKRSNVEALVNFIQSASEQDLCSVKTSKRDIVIPEGECLKIPCRVSHGPIDQIIPVSFEPEETSLWPSGLTFNETLLSVNPGKSNQVHIEAINTTNHDIVLPNQTLIGRLQLVQSVTPVEMKLCENELKPDQPSSDQTGNAVSDQEAGDHTMNILPSHLKIST